MDGEVQVTVGCCGVTMCLPTQLYNELRRSHRDFYCPNGHVRHFPGKTEDQKRIEALERRLDWWQGEYEELKRAATKCPAPGCPWRSQASPENLWKSMLQHFVRIHPTARIDELRELPAGERVPSRS